MATSVCDPELYSPLLEPKGCRLTLTQAGVFSAEYHRVRLAHCGMQSGAETLPRILEGAISDGQHVLMIQLQPGPPMYACGLQIDAESVGLLSASSPEFCLRLSGSSEWATISMTDDDWANYGRALAGLEPPFAPFRYADSPPRLAVDRLRRLLRSTMNFAAQAPDLLNNPEIARGLDNAIIAAAIACAISSDESRTLGGSRQHARVIREFTALVEQHAEGPLYLPEVCTALGVSARVFRQCCHDYFGVGPKRYLILRRMHLVRRALLNTIPGEETITSIATRFGFWELGRFSVAYREFFGEAPKATLRKKAPINS